MKKDILILLIFVAGLISNTNMAADQSSTPQNGAHVMQTNVPTVSSGHSIRAVLESKVYQDLMERHRIADETNDFGLYCLARTDGASYARSLFTNSTIRVEIGTNNLLVTEYFILDKVSNKSAKRFWAKVKSLSRSSAEVEGGWYTGPRASEAVLYQLKLIGGNWVIIKRTRAAIS